MSVVSLPPAVEDTNLDEELRLAEARLAELRRARKLRNLARSKQRAAERSRVDTAHKRASELPPPQSPRPSDYVFGAAAIAAVTGQTPSQVYYWFRAGLYGNAVWKAGHKTLMGSRSRLMNLGPPQS
jgi:hypothetical protein